MKKTVLTMAVILYMVPAFALSFGELAGCYNVFYEHSGGEETGNHLEIDAQGNTTLIVPGYETDHFRRYRRIEVLQREG